MQEAGFFASFCIFLDFMKNTEFLLKATKGCQKLLVSDIDGTITRDERVSCVVEKSLNQLASHGWNFLYATSREYETAVKIIKDLPGLPFGIFSDGAEVRRLMKEEVLFRRTIYLEIAKKVLEYCWQEEAEIQIYCADRIYTRSQDEKTLRYFGSQNIYVYTLDSWKNLEKPPLKILFYSRHYDIEKIRHKVDSLRLPVNQVFAGDCFLDILPQGISKASSLKNIFNFFEKRPDLTMVLADNENDRDLLLETDLSAVPDDAIPSLKEKADIIYPSDLERGIPLLAEFIINGVLLKGRTVFL